MEALQWKDIVEDPREVSLFQALEDDRWEWRTIEGLAKATGLTVEEVRGVLAKYPQLILTSSVPSPAGDDLYALQHRYYERLNPVQKIWTFVSGSSSTSTGS